ncbi:hypothetical protein NX784_22275 [Massilia pinisoli]|uniref:Uncharacterized protein n=1 Tax=Massilia pinisoli TaxID=1772194 RepID=A0ABT1ZWK0_9BURK|nr:hypothetical protein [Massilia pinisoli]MCS0584321.1 hypothetical protein [Massilia pinisoli]
MHSDDTTFRRLQEARLLDARTPGDRLMLDDATLAAALNGSRPLTAGERAALQASPLTVRRLRHLALERRAATAPWRGSRGVLRAASSGTLDAVVTEDGWWTLHFVAADGNWRAVLQLAPQAPFAPALLAARAPLRVLDGAGAEILAGQLDADGECEAAWPFAAAPGAHLQAHGARFTVEPRETGTP